ncbi:MCE family protein [Thermoleophilia bacterium SCSIO 60948]|nr:MCE family protein [Thermoleophilia bacterium SCSIO 60948]
MNGRGPAAAGVVVAAVLVVLAASALGAGGDERIVEAEFTSARGLIDGNDVRIDGAPAGTVSSIELTEEGRALVRMELEPGAPAAAADATAAIRPVDLIGDTYVALDPGEGEPLDGPIPASRTLDEPRLDDLLRTFDEPERAGVEAVLVESGVAMDRRGADLNAAAIELSPALEAADGVLRELETQNTSLARFVAGAQRVTSQAAAERERLGSGVDSLAAVLETSAAREDALAATLAGTPATLERLASLSGEIEATSAAAGPLAERVARIAPRLDETAARVEPFLGSVEAAAGDLRPAISRTTDLLEQAAPTLDAAAVGLDRTLATAPEYRSFLGALEPAAPAISEGFFVNFPDQAAEPGNQPFDPGTDPRRHYWRGAAVLTCQSFGVPIEPGCLADFLAGGRGGAASGDGSAGETAPPDDGGLPGMPGLPGDPGLPDPPVPPDLPDRLEDLPDRLEDLPDRLRDLPDRLRDRLRRDPDLRERLGGALGLSPGAARDDERVLDLLLGP